MSNLTMPNVSEWHCRLGVRIILMADHKIDEKLVLFIKISYKVILWYLNNDVIYYFTFDVKKSDATSMFSETFQL